MKTERQKSSGECSGVARPLKLEKYKTKALSSLYSIRALMPRLEPTACIM
jgi:hypothetical protein